MDVLCALSLDPILEVKRMQINQLELGQITDILNIAFSTVYLD